MQRPGRSDPCPCGSGKKYKKCCGFVQTVSPNPSTAQSPSPHNARPHDFIARLSGGLKIYLPRSIDLNTPYVVLEQEDWFEDEIRFVRDFLEPGMRAVDIGANYGIYTRRIQDPTATVNVWWQF